MSTDYKFEGWMGLGPDSVKGNLVWQGYEPKTWCEDDVDIKVMYTGICGSDLHTLRSGWGPTLYPCVVGHEIAGIVTRVGSQVKHLKVGDWAAVGAQNDSCRECEPCKTHFETLCDKVPVGTYNGKYQRDTPAKGDKSYGGYANYHRCPADFAFKIPDGLDPAIAAPLMCGGVTAYNPLRTYGAGTKAKRVGVIGLGGIGHFALLFAKALGAEVTVISHSTRKKDDAIKLGASDFICTHDKDFAASHRRTLDLIVCTSSSADMPLSDFLTILKPNGTLAIVGAPEEPLPPIAAFELLMGQVHITGSSIGSRGVIEEMLQLAAEKKPAFLLEKRPLTDANQAVVDLDNSKARYRYVLVNEANGGKL